MRRHPLPAFFILAYALTFMLSALATPGRLPWSLPAGARLAAQLLAHYGPAAAAVIVALASGGPAGLRDLLRPLGEWRVGLRWYLFILLYPLATNLIAVNVNVWLGGAPPVYFDAASLGLGPGLNVSPLLILPVVFLAILLQAGLAEEIGWRGFALPRLQARYSALASALILGALWAPWHYHPAQWAAVQPFVGWHIVAVVMMSVLMTWVYNHTRGSLLIAILFHTFSNLADWVIPVMPVGTGADPRPFAILTLINALVVGLIVAVYGPRHWRREPVPAPGAMPERSLAP